MFNFTGFVNNQYSHACQQATDIGVTMQNQFNTQINRLTTSCINFKGRCQHAAGDAKDACLETISKIENFLYQHKETLFFIGCSLATAYLAPSFFFPGLIISTIVRVEMARNLRNMADLYMKDEHNPYKLNPKYDTCVNTVDLTMGTIAAVDSVAIGIIFLSNAWTIGLIPFLGGVAAGSCLAKFGMNTSNFLG